MHEYFRYALINQRLNEVTKAYEDVSTIYDISYHIHIFLSFFDINCLIRCVFILFITKKFHRKYQNLNLIRKAYNTKLINAIATIKRTFVVNDIIIFYYNLKSYLASLFSSALIDNINKRLISSSFFPKGGNKSS